MYEQELRELGGNKEIDQDAYTIAEAAEVLGLQEAQAGKKLADAVEAGTWERVWKRKENGRVVMAFRPAPKAP